MKTKAPMQDVNCRFGRISGTLALVYVAVFAKFGLWQALTERCCGTVETADVRRRCEGGTRRPEDRRNA